MFTMPAGFYNAGDTLPVPPPLLSGWSTSKILILEVDLTAGNNLTDFPVLINLSSSSGKTSYDTTPVFDELGTNSKKIAVQSWDTGNECYCEIANWDSGTESAQIFFKALDISNSAPEKKFFYFYYDSAHADNTTYVGDTGSTPGQAVWNSNYECVYHLCQDPSVGGACILDSTSNANHGTPQGTMVSGDLVAADVGLCLSFDGTNYIQCPAAACQIDGSDFTVEAQLYVIADNDYYQVSKGVAGTFMYLQAGRRGSYNDSFLALYGSGSYDDGDALWDVSTWRGFAGTLNTTTDVMQVYLDGQADGSGATVTGSAVSTNDDYLELARYNGANSQCKMREVRITTTPCSADWESATYASNVDNYITFSAI